MDSDRIDWASLKKNNIRFLWEKSKHFFFFFAALSTSQRRTLQGKNLYSPTGWQVFGKWLLAVTSVKFLVVQWKPSCNFLGLKQVATVGSNFHGQWQLPNVCKQKGGEAIKDQCKPGTATIAFKVKRCNFNWHRSWHLSCKYLTTPSPLFVCICALEASLCVVVLIVFICGLLSKCFLFPLVCLCV